MEKSKTILIAGGYLKTKSLANSLTKQGYRVRVVNKNREACLNLAKSQSFEVIYGDASKPYVLEEADIDNVDIVIALTHSDADNIVICELAKKRYHVKKTVSLVNDPKKISFFYQMGIDSVVCATNAVVAIIEQQALMDELLTTVPIGEGRCNVLEVPIMNDSPVVNCPLKRIHFPKGVIVGCILRGEENVVPDGDVAILSGDVLVIIASGNKEIQTVQMLTGK